MRLHHLLSDGPITHCYGLRAVSAKSGRANTFRMIEPFDFSCFLALPISSILSFALRDDQLIFFVQLTLVYQNRIFQ